MGARATVLVLRDFRPAGSTGGREQAFRCKAIGLHVRRQGTEWVSDDWIVANSQLRPIPRPRYATEVSSTLHTSTFQPATNDVRPYETPGATTTRPEVKVDEIIAIPDLSVSMPPAPQSPPGA